MNASDLADRLTPILTALPEVKVAYLFGSHAQGRPRPDSDIDVGVLLTRDAAAEPRAALARLFDHLGRAVPSDRLDVVILNDAPALLRHRVLSHGRLLFERTPVDRVRFATRAIQDYQDMQIRREFFYRKRVSRLKEGESDGRSGDLLAQARRVARLLGEARDVSGGS
jgi:predicted nucleotidyltransferase